MATKKTDPNHEYISGQEVPLPLSDVSAVIEEINFDNNQKMLISSGVGLCPNCFSQKRTDLNGKLFCPQEKKDCPLITA